MLRAKFSLIGDPVRARWPSTRKRTLFVRLARMHPWQGDPFPVYLPPRCGWEPAVQGRHWHHRRRLKFFDRELLDQQVFVLNYFVFRPVYINLHWQSFQHFLLIILRGGFVSFMLCYYFQNLNDTWVERLWQQSASNPHQPIPEHPCALCTMLSCGGMPVDDVEVCKFRFWSSLACFLISLEGVLKMLLIIDKDLQRTDRVFCIFWLFFEAAWTFHKSFKFIRWKFCICFAKPNSSQCLYLYIFRLTCVRSLSSPSDPRFHKSSARSGAPSTQRSGQRRHEKRIPRWRLG